MPPVPHLRPFRPGFGGAPPYLAGREGEQESLREYLVEIAGGGAPGTALFLYGPRGNGKTVLLDWMEREAAAAGVETAALRPAEIVDAARLRESLAPRSWWERVASGEIAAGGFSWKPGVLPPPPVGEVLLARAGADPLVLLVDEAHTLDLAVGRILLNAAQEAGGKVPCLLVLAGTPDLPKRLRRMNASFWARGTQIRVGRLTDAAAAEAIRVPLVQHGVSVAGDILDSMVRDCHGYPYFTQVWGDAIWRQICDDASGKPRPEVTATDRRLARERFEKTRDAYYQLRYGEIADERLLPAARAVADAFVAAGKADGDRGAALTYEQLDAAVERGLGGGADPDRALAARHRLDHLGFIWGTARGPFWEPGIPNLMDYLRRYAPPVDP